MSGYQLKVYEAFQELATSLAELNLPPGTVKVTLPDEHYDLISGVLMGIGAGGKPTEGSHLLMGATGGMLIEIRREHPLPTPEQLEIAARIRRGEMP